MDFNFLDLFLRKAFIVKAIDPLALKVLIALVMYLTFGEKDENAQKSIILIDSD